MAHLKVVLLTKRHRLETCTASNHKNTLLGGVLMTETILTKICSKCNTEKLLSVSEFHKQKSHKDGFTSHCKLCRNANYHENSEKISARRAVLYQINPEPVKDRVRAYRELNLGQIKERARDRYKANPKKFNIRDKKYRKKNPEKLNEYEKARNKTKSRKATKQKANQKRRALKHSAKVEDFNHSEIFERDGYICQSCKKKTRSDYKPTHPLYPHLDHIVPLSLGGEHSRKNVQCLCKACNLTKNNTGTGDQLRLF